NLSPGEVATVFVVAADRRQARVVMRYVDGLIDGNPMLARMVTKRATESIELSNRTVIEVGTCSIRTLRGYTLAAAILDEIAFWSRKPHHERSTPTYPRESSMKRLQTIQRPLLRSTWPSSERTSKSSRASKSYRPASSRAAVHGPRSQMFAISPSVVVKIDVALPMLRQPVFLAALPSPGSATRFRRVTSSGYLRS